MALWCRLQHGELGALSASSDPSMRSFEAETAVEFFGPCGLLHVVRPSAGDQRQNPSRLAPRRL